MPAPSLPSTRPTKEAAPSPTKVAATQSTTDASEETATQPAQAHAAFVCPECGRSNSESVEFCTHCHHTLLFRCPMCWSEQRHGGTCDKCHLDLEKYWRVKGASEQAQLIRDESSTFEKSVEPPRSILLTLLAIPLRFLPFGEWLGATLLLNWLRKRYPDLP
jgi:hypothetical protein